MKKYEEPVMDVCVVEGDIDTVMASGPDGALENTDISDLFGGTE